MSKHSRQSLNPRHLVRWLLLFLLLGGLNHSARGAELPSVAPREVPMLPLAEGRRVMVDTADELAAAIRDAQDGDVILLADGTYRVGNVLKLDRVKNVSIRGAASNPASVILRGLGFDAVNRAMTFCELPAARKLRLRT